MGIIQGVGGLAAGVGDPAPVTLADGERRFEAFSKRERFLSNLEKLVAD